MSEVGTATVKLELDTSAFDEALTAAEDRLRLFVERVTVIMSDIQKIGATL